MKRSRKTSCLLALFALASLSHGLSVPRGGAARPAFRLASSTAAGDLGSTVVSMDRYDIVKVDLEDGRDYPIYIGTEYSDEEG
jgi:hypothetical protein